MNTNEPTLLDLPLSVPAARQPRFLTDRPEPHLNLICPNLSLGGAERIVLDLITSMSRSDPNPGRGHLNLFLLRRGSTEYRVPEIAQLTVHRLHELPESQRLRFVAWHLIQAKSQTVYGHLLTASEILQLCRYGITVLPVVHNQSPAWTFDPTIVRRAVPWLTAVANSVATEIRHSVPSFPCHVVKHELQRECSATKAAANRLRIRSKYRIGNSLLIGMIGKFKPQKRYDFAVKILKALSLQISAHLMILAPISDDRDSHVDNYRRVIKLADSLRIRENILFIDSCGDPRPYYAAFDCFLNTSEYEGLSIATLEARQFGLPLILSDVGGQREVGGDRTCLLKADAPVGSYVAAIRAAGALDRRDPLPRPHPTNLIPRLWSMLAAHGVQTTAPSRTPSLLFVTCNLNQGGAQRSMINLLDEITLSYPTSVCVEQAAYRDDYVSSLEERGIDCFSLQRLPSLCDQIDALLSYVDSNKISAICFWHAGVRIKSTLSKVLQFRSIRLIDVSPGPHLFRELDNATGYLERIAWSPTQYFERLDRFVAKYNAGGIPGRFGDFTSKTIVIPNGVPYFQDSVPNSSELYARPSEADPKFAVVSSGRLVPAKLIIEQLQVASIVRRQVPQFTLTFIGKVEGTKNLPYWQEIEETYKKLTLQGTVFFVGTRAEPNRALREFVVFLMLSYFQGCPNSSLEAMAAGLPVVANPDGGTVDQVVDGETGFLVPETELPIVAERLIFLLRNPELARTMGAVGQKRVRDHFSMHSMAAQYRALFDETIKDPAILTSERS
jgi:glycosyltransferase involved in cell wall biosynthesis